MAQVVPQVPQFVVLVRVSTQRPAHTAKGAAQVQAPFTQERFCAHCWPQMPQFATLVCRSMHCEKVPPPPPNVQRVRPPVQVVPQVPLSQTCPWPQRLPQVPQLKMLVAVYVQAPLQTVAPAGHWQAPFTQAAFCAQVVPQAPHACVSVRRLRHVLPQSVVPEPHTHRPAEQIWPWPHWVPQAPQFCASVCVFTQAPRQSVPLVQAHVPALQV